MVTLGGFLWIKDHLDYTTPIAQVNEYQTAVVAAAVYPAGQSDSLADMAFLYLSAIMAL
jgi:hypothetical protein